MFNIGDRVTDKNRKVSGIVVGHYMPKFYICYLVPKDKQEQIIMHWSKVCPGWEKELVPVVLYDESQFIQSKEEFEEWLGVTDEVEYVVYEKLTPKYLYMALPYNQLTLEEAAS